MNPTRAQTLPFYHRFGKPGSPITYAPLSIATREHPGFRGKSWRLDMARLGLADPPLVDLEHLKLEG